jgi:hypothetical protein
MLLPSVLKKVAPDVGGRCGKSCSVKSAPQLAGCPPLGSIWAEEFSLGVSHAGHCGKRLVNVTDKVVTHRVKLQADPVQAAGRLGTPLPAGETGGRKRSDRGGAGAQETVPVDQVEVNQRAPFLN